MIKTKSIKKYDYGAVNFPKKILKDVDFYVEKYPDEIRSRADFCHKAVKGLLEIYRVMGSETERQRQEKQWMKDYDTLNRDTILGKLDYLGKEIEKLKKK